MQLHHYIKPRQWWPQVALPLLSHHSPPCYSHFIRTGLRTAPTHQGCFHLRATCADPNAWSALPPDFACLVLSLYSDLCLDITCSEKHLLTFLSKEYSLLSSPSTYSFSSQHLLPPDIVMPSCLFMLGLCLPLKWELHEDMKHKAITSCLLFMRTCLQCPEQCLAPRR